MLPSNADPVLNEARAIALELRGTRRALLVDAERIYGEPTALRLRDELSGASATEVAKIAAQQPEPLRLLATGLAELHARKAGLLSVPENRERIDSALTDRARTLRIAVEALRSSRRQETARERMHAVIAQAAASRRSLRSCEEIHIEQLRDQAAAPHQWAEQIRTPEIRDEVFDALGALRLRRARQELRQGLVRTDQMQSIIRESLPALRRGEPLLLVGETGGAKTALAEYLAHNELNMMSELVSGYGDITSSQVIGTTELRAESGATRSEFVAGPMLRAMTDGHPLILDEINAMPPEFLKRLNRVLQLRPGDRFAVQENAGRPVTIAEGFVIIATANEQTPHRYRGIEPLSAELLNRFGANSYRVRYPDSQASFSDFPRENALLAAAAVVNRHGEFDESVSPDEIERVARAAFISQQVFTGTRGEGFSDFVSSERTIDGRPGLEESVLAPRTLVSILEKVTGSAGAVTVEQALTRFVEGVLHREDRHVLTLILEGQGFRITVPQTRGAAKSADS